MTDVLDLLHYCHILGGMKSSFLSLGCFPLCQGSKEGDDSPAERQQLPRSSIHHDFTSLMGKRNLNFRGCRSKALPEALMC